MAIQASAESATAQATPSGAPASGLPVKQDQTGAPVFTGELNDTDTFREATRLLRSKKILTDPKQEEGVIRMKALGGQARKGDVVDTAFDEHLDRGIHAALAAKGEGKATPPAAPKTAPRVGESDFERKLREQNALDNPPAEEGQPEEGAAPEGESEVEAEVPAEAEGAEDGDVIEGEIVEGEAERPPQYRLRPQNPVEAMAFAGYRADPSKGMAFYIQAAQKALGVSDASATAPATVIEVEPPIPAGMPKSVDETRAKIAALRKEKATALTAYDADKVAELEDQIDQLNDHAIDLRQRDSVRRQNADAAFHRSVETSKAKAVALYPDVTQKESALTKEIVRLDAELKANDDPLYNSPEKPLKLAQMAAANLSIAPRSAKPKAAPAAPVRKPQPPKAGARPVQPVSPAGGGARTTPKTNDSGRLEGVVDKVKDEDGYQGLKRLLKAA